MDEAIAKAGRSLHPPEADAADIYEVVDGVAVAKPLLNAYECYVASNLSFEVAHFARTRSLGRGIGNARFVLDADGRLCRRPAAAFISFSRWPADRPVPPGEAWDVVPDLVAEVLTRAEPPASAERRVGEYVRAGVRRVWIVLPADERVHAHAPKTWARTLGLGDTLDGGDVLPGFRLALGDLFGRKA